MLAASPSPGLTPPAHQSDTVSGFLNPSLRRDNLSRVTSSKGTSPIVKPPSAHVSAHPLAPPSQSPVPTQAQPSPSQVRNSTSRPLSRPPCPSPVDQRPQPPSVRSIGTQTSSSPIHSASRPSLPTDPPPVVMVDAQTQYSPTLALSSDPAPYLAVKDHLSPQTPVRSITPTTTSNLANLHLTKSEPATIQQPYLASAPATGTHSNKRPHEPIADAAMPAAPSGLTTTTYSSEKEQGRSKTDSSLSTTPQSSAKRGHSTTISETEPTIQPHQRNGAHSHHVETSSPPVETSPTPSKKPRPADPEVKIMPLRYETCDTRDLVILISSMLMELIRYNDTIPLSSGSGSDVSTSNLTRFHSRAPPGISVIDYLQRLTTHATLSPPILLSMVYYIDRLASYYPAFTISSLTVHRFLITAATVASKGLSDSFWTNKTYARVGGVSVKELALLELEFLVRVQWRIVPRPETLVDYYKSLVGRSIGYRMEEDGDSGTSADQNSDANG